jgi:hypothetical protein
VGKKKRLLQVESIMAAERLYSYFVIDNFGFLNQNQLYDVLHTAIKPSVCVFVSVSVYVCMCVVRVCSNTFEPGDILRTSVWLSASWHLRIGMEESEGFIRIDGVRLLVN